MKVSRLVSLVSAITATLALAGCSTNIGKTPQTAESMNAHGIYWKQDARYSVAKNAFSLAGIDVDFSEQEIKPGSDSDNFLSKFLVNGSMGFVTGGFQGLSIMSLSSLYSAGDAEYIQVNQFVVFVPNPNNLSYDDEQLIKSGAKYAITFVSDGAQKWGVNSKKRANAVDNCKIDKAVINKWSGCTLSGKPSPDISATESLFLYQPIRPANGKELPQLDLPVGNYAVMRYAMIPSGFADSSLGFKGIIIRPDIKNSTPKGLAASINGKDYYLFSGELGQKGFPEKTEAPGASYKL